VGVMHRVEELADRSHAEPPATAGTVQSLVPLPEMLAEICQVGAKSKRVSQHYESLLGQLGPELALLNEVPLEDIRNTTSSLLAEAIARLRRHEVICEAGFDGEYGTIRLFQAEELRQRTLGASLFAIPTSPPQSAAQSRSSAHPTAQARETSGGKTAVLPVATAPAQRPLTGHESSAKAFDLLSELDTEQRLAATAGPGPLLIVAGPGSGKTRTLMYRLAHLVCHHGVPATQCLAITFTHRAAEEMRQRLHRLLPEVWTQIPVLTFHALGLGILREHWNAAGLQRGFRIVAEAERLRLLGAALGSSASQARRLLAAISHHKRTAIAPAEAKLAHAYQIYQQELEIRNLVDYDDLIGRAGAVLASDPGLQALYQARYPWVFIDEYQDVDEQQVRLLKLLVPPHGNVCAIGDPDQAIYGFRGADVRFFQRFPEDFPTAQVVRLTRNYRSDRHIVTLSSQVLGRAGGEPRSVAVRASEPSLITLHEAPSEKAEAEFVVQAIEQMLGGHSFFSIDSGRTENGTGDAVSFADVAILYRTEAQTPALVEALQRSGMPFQKRSHALLTEHPGVAILLDTLRQGQRQGSLYEQLQAAVAHATSQVETPLAAAEITSLHEALDLVKPLAEACGEDVERFLTDLALEVQVDTRDARADRISLLTLHASKGLEFPVVFLVGCEETLLPLTWGSAADTDLEEERRLFYVGVTRAQNRLFLCRARQRLWRGRVQAMAPSPYLADIEEGLLERRHTRLQGGHRMPERQLNLF
jgi:DNA helicase-2/ATP-dependent DNA helicase PcrA